MGIKKLINRLTPQIIDKRTSAISGKLEVVRQGDELLLNTTHANYSFGSAHRVFRKALHSVSGRVPRGGEVLILGFGAGSVARILNVEMSLGANITGIEKDEVVLELGTRYFNTGDLEQCSVIQGDAFEFLSDDNTHYDLICVDLFQGLEVPEPFLSGDFSLLVRNHLKQDGLLVFNHVSDTFRRRQQIKALRDTYQALFSKAGLLKCSRVNRVLIAHR